MPGRVYQEDRYAQAWSNRTSHSKDARGFVLRGNYRHGACLGGIQSPEYRAYAGAKNRCSDPARPYWFRYGGRGIKFLYKDFNEFFRDLGPKPSPKHSLDRIDNNGNYEPGNCRWATSAEQQLNKTQTSGKSGVLGVSLYKRSGLYKAYLYREGKVIHIGYYKTVSEAAAAREQALKADGLIRVTDERRHGAQVLVSVSTQGRLL